MRRKYQDKVDFQSTPTRSNNEEVSLQDSLDVKLIHYGIKVFKGTYQDTKNSMV